MYKIKTSKSQMHHSDKKPLFFLLGFLIAGFLILFFIVKQCGTYNDRAIEAFSKYTKIHHIKYDSYDCGTRLDENDRITCTYNIFGEKPQVLSCECNAIGYNICYPVNKIY